MNKHIDHEALEAKVKQISSELSRYAVPFCHIHDDKVWFHVEGPEEMSFLVKHDFEEIMDWDERKPFKWYFHGITPEVPAEDDGSHLCYSRDWARKDSPSWRGFAWRKTVSALITGYMKVYNGDIYKPENYDEYIAFTNYRGRDESE